MLRKRPVEKRKKPAPSFLRSRMSNFESLSYRRRAASDGTSFPALLFFGSAACCLAPRSSRLSLILTIHVGAGHAHGLLEFALGARFHFLGKRILGHVRPVQLMAAVLGEIGCPLDHSLRLDNVCHGVRLLSARLLSGRRGQPNRVSLSLSLRRGACANGSATPATRTPAGSGYLLEREFLVIVKRDDGLLVVGEGVDDRAQRVAYLDPFHLRGRGKVLAVSGIRLMGPASSTSSKCTMLNMCDRSMSFLSSATTHRPCSRRFLSRLARALPSVRSTPLPGALILRRRLEGAQSCLRMLSRMLAAHGARRRFRT